MNAATYNRRTQLDPGWTVDQIWQATRVQIEGPGDAHGIRAAQQALGVTPDGLFGPASIAAMHRKINPATIYDGKSRLGKAPAQVTCIIVHHSVTRTHAGMLRALDAKGASTHYSIGPDGTRHTLCDPDRMTGHAGPWNRASIGIDMISPYSPRLWRDGEPWDRPVPTGAGWGERYGVLRRRSVIPDTRPALVELDALLDELCARFGLAKSWPRVGARMDKALDPRALGQSFGIFAHGCVSTSRWDGWGALMGLESMRRRLAA